MASMERRRGLAFSDHLPPALKALWTVGERAVLKVMADEWMAHGVCDLSLNELAARAGVCRSVAKRTVWLAERADGLISVERRPRSGRKHLTNIIRIVRAEWIDWLNKGNRRASAVGACKRAKPDFRIVQAMRRARGVKIDPPRGQVLRTNEQRSVDNRAQNPWAWPAERK
jgi:hypothetical protein